LTLFVTFEGTEGSGKTTQINLLCAALQAMGQRVLVTREPGGTEIGERLRGLLLESDAVISAEAEAYLMTAARAEHVRRVIRPALDSGAIVLCDRFYDSTFAYQGAGRGLPINVLESMQELAVGSTHPELTILLDLPVEVGLVRREGEQYVNRIDRESIAFHARVANWYRETALRHPDRWRIVDAALSPELVHTGILDCVVPWLKAVTVPRDDRGSSS
jgi:dTMP kinase